MGQRVDFESVSVSKSSRLPRSNASESIINYFMDCHAALAMTLFFWTGYIPENKILPLWGRIIIDVKSNRRRCTLALLGSLMEPLLFHRMYIVVLPCSPLMVFVMLRPRTSSN